MSNLSPLIKAFIVLDSEGKRLCVNYYPTCEYKTLNSQLVFEKNLFNKSKGLKSDVEVIMIDKVITVYKHTGDVYVYCVGSNDENELILASMITCFEESLQALFTPDTTNAAVPVDKKLLIDNLDLTLLIVDEMIDDGIILENDPILIAGRVALRGPDADVPLAELTFSQALETARTQLIRSFR